MKEQLNTVMNQIKALQGDEPPAASRPGGSTETPASSAAPPPVIIGSLMDKPIQPHDVVQVVNRESRLYGVLFQIGGIRKQRVHGFYLLPGAAKEFVTVDLSDVRRVGESHVRSKTPCSAKWSSENQ